MKKIVNIFEDNYIIFLVYAFLGWVYEVVWIYCLDGILENRGFLFGPFLPVYGFGMLFLVLLLRKMIKNKHYSNSVYIFPVLIFFINFIYIMAVEYSQPKIYSVIEFLSKYGMLQLFLSIIGVVISFLFINGDKKKNKDITLFLVFILIFVIATVVEYISHFALDKLSGIILWDYSKDFLNVNKRICFDASRNFAILGTFAMYAVQPFVDKFVKKVDKKKKHIIVLVFLIPMLIDWLIHMLG